MAKLRSPGQRGKLKLRSALTTSASKNPAALYGDYIAITDLNANAPAFGRGVPQYAATASSVTHIDPADRGTIRRPHYAPVNAAAIDRAGIDANRRPVEPAMMPSMPAWMSAPPGRRTGGRERGSAERQRGSSR